MPIKEKQPYDSRITCTHTHAHVTMRNKNLKFSEHGSKLKQLVIKNKTKQHSRDINTRPHKQEWG